LDVASVPEMSSDQWLSSSHTQEKVKKARYRERVCVVDEGG
jgi:hypothetical protein